MPFYEYECPACRHYAEVMQKISDAPLKKCPSCGKGGFKRLISAPVFRLKGSGWYETDFKSDKEGKRNLAGADKEEAKPAAESKGDAPAAPATPAAPAGPAAPVAKSESTPGKTAEGRGARRSVAKPVPVKASAKTSASRAGRTGRAKSPARRK